MRLHLGGCACPGCMSAATAEREDGAVPALPGDANATKPVFTEDKIIAALTNIGGRYGAIAWNGSTVSYSIGTGRLSSTHAEYDSEYAGYAAMTRTMERTAAQAFELWDDLIAIDLVERSDDPNANITFNYSAATGNATYAKYWFYEKGGRADHTMSDADIWFATGWSTHDEDRDLFQGGYGVLSYIHEIGHGLGLRHPGEYNGRATFAADATHFQDTRAYTVMSYFNAHENGSGTDHVGTAGRRYAATPLLNDILAVQAIYGADMTTRKGATVYGFGSTAGRDAFDFTKNTGPVVAIWDAGGIDKIDVSGWSTDQVVDLNEGAFSSVGHLTDNLAIAYGAVIEKAVAGGGDDLLIGNGAQNMLSGRAGDDRLFGNGGDDTLCGGAGADHLDGGAGTDWARYARASGGVAVDLARGAGTRGIAAGDTYASIENVGGTEHADLLVGDAAANLLEGGGGNDRLRGGAGRDTLSGGDGADILTGGSGDDRLLGDAGDDLLEGNSGADYLHGGLGIDTASYRGSGSAVAVDLGTGRGTLGAAQGDRLLYIENLQGSAFDDKLVGNARSNLLRGDAGDDLLFGQGGNDRLEGGAGADKLVGDQGSDWALYTGSGKAVTVDLARGLGKGGDAEGDRYYSIENVVGSAAGDVLTGTSGKNRLEGRAGDDRLFGDSGDDALFGGDGDDVLVGGRGRDVLDGGAGADLFVFNAGDGHDRIADFELARDMIQFIGAVTAFDQLAITQSSAGAAIDYGASDLLVLAAVSAQDIGEGLFVFG